MNEGSSIQRPWRHVEQRKQSFSGRSWSRPSFQHNPEPPTPSQHTPSHHLPPGIVRLSREVGRHNQPPAIAQIAVHRLATRVSSSKFFVLPFLRPASDSPNSAACLLPLRSSSTSLQKLQMFDCATAIGFSLFCFLFSCFGEGRREIWKSKDRSREFLARRVNECLGNRYAALKVLCIVRCYIVLYNIKIWRKCRSNIKKYMLVHVKCWYIL